MPGLAETPTAAPPSTTPTDAEAATLLPPIAFDIVAGESVGSIDAASTEADLKNVFGTKNVRYMNVPLGSELLKGFRVWSLSVVFPSNDPNYQQRLRDAGASADLARAAVTAELNAELDRQVRRACQDRNASAWAEANRENADSSVRDLASRVLDVRGASYKSRVSWLATKGRNFDPTECQAR